MIPSKQGCTMKLSFLGAAGEVTGSCLRVDHDQGSFLVDCGMFQGGREADAKNRRALDFDLAGMHFQDFFSSFQVGKLYRHTSVKTSGT